MRHELEQCGNPDYIVIHFEDDLKPLFPMSVHSRKDEIGNEQINKMTLLEKIAGVEQLSTISRYSISLRTGRLADKEKVASEVVSLVEGWLK